MSEELDLLQESVELESWVMTVGSSLVFNGKSLDDWNSFLKIPTVSNSSEMTLPELEMLNTRALSLIESVMSNLASSKTSFFSAKAAYEIAMIKKRNAIFKEHELSNLRLPSSENLEKRCTFECLKAYKTLLLSEVVYEFWNVQSYKLNRYNERLTSINITKQKL